MKLGLTAQHLRGEFALVGIVVVEASCCHFLSKCAAR
jgi:hypothetical protein